MLHSKQQHRSLTTPKFDACALNLKHLVILPLQFSVLLQNPINGNIGFRHYLLRSLLLPGRQAYLIFPANECNDDVEICSFLPYENYWTTFAVKKISVLGAAIAQCLPSCCPGFQSQYTIFRFPLTVYCTIIFIVLRKRRK